MTTHSPVIAPEETNKKIDVSEARKTFADLLSQVGFGKERIVLCRNGKKIAALIPIADLTFFERLEDEYDLAAARKTLENPGWMTSKEARKKLGIK